MVGLSLFYFAGLCAEISLRGKRFVASHSLEAWAPWGIRPPQVFP
jgi:hypothetical protein